MPVYILIAGAFFPQRAGLVLLGMYALGIVLAIFAAKVMSRFFKDDDLPFVMELPPYHMPPARNVLRSTWERGWSFVKKAGTVILLSTVLLWFLQSFGFENGF